MEFLGSKEEAFEKQDIETQDVDVEEWGCTVRVKMMTGMERDSFEASIMEGGQKANFNNVRAKLLVRSIVNDQGVRIFTDRDADMLGQKSGRVLDKLFKVAQKLNGMGKEDIDEMTKN